MAISVFMILMLFILVYFLSRIYKFLKKKFDKTFFFEPRIYEEKFNPDISTDNWDLHKLRLEKFRRSQYKGLTFFVSSENRIYYLSEEGYKVYC